MPADAAKNRTGRWSPDCRPFSRGAAAGLTKLYDTLTLESKSSVSAFRGGKARSSGFRTPSNPFR